MNIKDNFNIENQYQLYLKRVGLAEKRMHPQQKVETRRAFFGACGQMLIMLRDDITKLSDEKAFSKLEEMTKEVKTYFINETFKQN